MRKFFAVLAAFFLFSAPAAAMDWDDFSTPEHDWRDSALLRSSDPLARKLALWLTVTETDDPADTATLARFALQNPDWPRLGAFRERVEKKADSLPPALAAAWFAKNPPRTADGLRAFPSALKTVWPDVSLGKKDTLALAPRLTAADHRARLDNLLWEARLGEAESMLPLVSPDQRKLAQARIALLRFSSAAPRLLREVPGALQADEGLLYARVRYRREMGKDADAEDLLRLSRDKQHPDLWWRERNILARRAIEKHHYDRARKIIAGHGLTSGPDYAVALWTLGWLELEHLGHPDAAYRHFYDFYGTVVSAVSRARAAWWLARADEKLGRPQNAQNWYKLGALFPSTFYGQLCREKLGLHDAAAFLLPPPAPRAALENASPSALENHDLAAAVRLLARHGLQKHIDQFLKKLLDLAQKREDFLFVARLALESHRLHYAIEANKQMQFKIGEFMYEEGYPLLPTLPSGRPEPALVHAIVHRESLFNTEALSPAGARGLMQLMPGTAKDVARKTRNIYSESRLTRSPAYNVELGAAYLQDLIDDYDGFYPLAIAAYNAGPANVREWLDAFGDPRSKSVNVIDWIESIPIYETRNYVQRVLEDYYLYRLRLGETPKTIFDFRR